MMQMKALFFGFLITLSSALWAQETMRVESSEIDLGKISETLGKGVKRVRLILGQTTPDNFKVKFIYKYQFVSHELESVSISSQGSINGYSTRKHVEDFEGKKTLHFSSAEALFRNGEDLALMLEISKPNKNTHGVKIKVLLPSPQGHAITGGKKLLGLLGHHYSVVPQCAVSPE